MDTLTYVDYGVLFLLGLAIGFWLTVAWLGLRSRSRNKRLSDKLENSVQEAKKRK